MHFLSFLSIWVRSRSFGCLVTWFCYHLIAKPGNKTAEPSWPDPYKSLWVVDIQGIQCQLGHQQLGLWLVMMEYSFTSTGRVNSLAPGRPGCHFKTAIFNLVLLIGILISSNDNALRWMPWHLTDEKSTLVQVMAWYRQATSHYLSQCWPISMSPYGVARPQRVNECCRLSEKKCDKIWGNIYNFVVYVYKVNKKRIK